MDWEGSTLQVILGSLSIVAFALIIAYSAFILYLEIQREYRRLQMRRKKRTTSKTS